MLKQQLKKIEAQTFICLGVLLTLVLFCYARTLSSYFLADDFGEVRYVSNIFHGHPELIWANFTGNFMQIPSMSVWRPGLLITLIWDYLLYGGSPYGYFLSNLIYFALAVILVFFVARRLTTNFSGYRGLLTSFFSAAIFAVYPLHSESISWIVGRVDIACAVAYLLSFYMAIDYIQDPRKRTAILSSIFFFCALSIKEMAIGLPLLVFSYAFLRPDQNLATTNILNRDAATNATNEYLLPYRNRIAKALFLTIPYLAVTAIYFSIRLLALGTILGGYTGSIGDMQTANILSKWLDPDTLYRIFHPLNFVIFHNSGLYLNLITIAYIIALAILSWRFLINEFPIRQLLFLSVWLFTCIVPLYKLWGLGYNLEGSRFYFFATIPLALMLPTLLFANFKYRHSRVFEERMYALSFTAVVILIFAFTRVAYANNLVWVHAGKDVRTCIEQAKTIAQSLGYNKQVIVLGIPKEHFGAHQIYNGATFGFCLNKPFQESNLSDHFLTFDPILFGHSELINPDRLRSCLSNRNVEAAYVFDGKSFKKLDSLFQGQAPSVDRVSRQTPIRLMSDGFMLDKAIDPLSYDYACVEVKTNAAAPLQAVVSFDNCLNIPDDNGTIPNQFEGSGFKIYPLMPIMSNKWQKVYIPLSNTWRYFLCPSLNHLWIHISSQEEVAIGKVTLMPSIMVSPKITVKNQDYDNRGVYNTNLNNRLVVRVNTTNIEEAAWVTLELGKCNFFFDNFENEDVSSYLAKTIKCHDTKCQFVLTKRELSQPGYYQIRALAYDRSGKRLGAYSYPITVYVN